MPAPRLQVPQAVCPLLQLHICQHPHAPESGVTAAARSDTGKPAAQHKPLASPRTSGRATHLGRPTAPGQPAYSPRAPPQPPATLGTGARPPAAGAKPPPPRLPSHSGSAAMRAAPWPRALGGAPLGPRPVLTRSTSCDARRLQSRSSGCTSWRACEGRTREAAGGCVIRGFQRRGACHALFQAVRATTTAHAQNVHPAPRSHQAQQATCRAPRGTPHAHPRP